jgi:hypothetical protein
VIKPEQAEALKKKIESAIRSAAALRELAFDAVDGRGLYYTRLAIAAEIDALVYPSPNDTGLGPHGCYGIARGEFPPGVP